MVSWKSILAMRIDIITCLPELFEGPMNQSIVKRAKKKGYSYPTDSPWQQELEDSFPYQPTPDQLQAIREVKIDLESVRPMDLSLIHI